MSEKTSYEASVSSDALRNPQRIAFITRNTSAKVRGDMGRRFMSYPHLILRESIAFQLLTIVLVLISLLWDAPLEQLANPLATPNPAKAPWYFLGLQELLHYFPPIVAGVLIPTLVVMALVVIPYFRINIHGKPLWAEDRIRRFQIFTLVVFVLILFLILSHAWTVIVPTTVVAGFATLAYFITPNQGRWQEFLRTRTLPWWVMTWFIVVSLCLTLVGTFFRGPGWTWVWPWS
jgi:menaquinol-cytochrome c reductase cytochrome b/c subunit